MLASSFLSSRAMKKMALPDSSPCTPRPSLGLALKTILVFIALIAVASDGLSLSLCVVVVETFKEEGEERGRGDGRWL